MSICSDRARVSVGDRAGWLAAAQPTLSAGRRVQPLWLLLTLAFAVGAEMMRIGQTTAWAEEPLTVWIGTANSPGSRGIYRVAFDPATGRLGAPELAAEVSGPGFLAMHSSGQKLYAVCQIAGEGVVAEFSILSDQSPPVLRLERSEPIGDGGGTHLAIDPSGQVLLTAQYGGGSVAAFGLREDGQLLARRQLLEHQGAAGVVADRQAGPHPHWVGFTPEGNWALVPDLGLDQVLRHRLRPDQERPLEPAAAMQLHPGAGPRHMKFHPNGRWAYVLNELDLTVTQAVYTAATGQLEGVGHWPTLTAEQLAAQSFNSAAEIRMHPTGKWLYTSNRGHDSISVFRIDPYSGHLERIQVEPMRGATPRNFNLDPSGRWLLAAGQDSDTLSCFEIDSATGRLRYQHQIVQVPSPICVLFEPE
jgi:6-phosphogluconolactonase